MSTTVQSARDLTDQARTAEQQGDLSAAATLYRQAHDAEPSAFRASRLIHCLRKQSLAQAQAAARFAREVHPQHHADQWFVREYVWAVYDGYLRSHEGHYEQRNAPPPDVDLMRKAVERILSLTQDDLPRRLAAFAFCKAAAQRNRWHDVLEVAGRLDGASLPADPEPIGSHTGPSPRQRWLNLMARARFETGHFADCRRLAETGRAEFPRETAFERWSALARIEEGDVDGGLQALERLARRSPPQWYVLWDVARIHRKRGGDGEALRWLCEAALASGDLDGRITLFGDLSEALAACGETQSAADHRLLAWSLAVRNGWERRAEKERDLLPSPRPDTPPPVALAEKPCRAHWRKVVDESFPVARGRVKMWNAERGFGFIASESGRDVHFRARDFRGRPEVGLKARFRVRPSFDAKKGVDSFVATQVEVDG